MSLTLLSGRLGDDDLPDPDERGLPALHHLQRGRLVGAGHCEATALVGMRECPVGHLGAEAAEALAQHVAVVEGGGALVSAARAVQRLAVVLPELA